MDKMLIEVFCVATSKSYDFWISKKMVLAKVKEKILEQIQAYEKNTELFQQAEQVFMMEDTQASILEEAWTVEEAGLHSGDKVVII
jgi:hypothetical protein